MPLKFYTIREPTTGLFKDRGSKFLSFAYPVSTVEEVSTRLTELKKKYHDARHWCYAYSIGTKKVSIRANDDGEPMHSAGDPILGQLKSHGLSDCLVVVVRYFGGTKLGVPGLINAYKTAASEALGMATKEEIIDRTELQLSFSYEKMGLIERWISEFEAVDVQRTYKTSCAIQFKIKTEAMDALLVRLTDQPDISMKQ